MKALFKRAMVALAFLTITYSASAQMFVGGSIGYKYTKAVAAGSKAWAVNLSPETGYIFNETWAVGGRLLYAKSVSKTETPYLSDTKIDVEAFTINPYAVYAPIRYGNFTLCAELGLQFIPRQKSLDFCAYNAYAVPVLSYSFNEHIIFKTTLNCAGVTIGGSSSGDFIFGLAAKGNEAFNLSDLSVGLVYSF